MERTVAELMQAQINLGDQYDSAILFLAGETAKTYTEEHRRLIRIQNLHISIQRDCLNLRIKLLREEEEMKPPASKETRWKHRVQTELAELIMRRNKLHDHMTSPEFQTLDLVSQTLLEAQLNIMDSYSNILMARIRAVGGRL